MTNVYVLSHTLTTTVADEERMIGVFSDYQHAEKAMQGLSVESGFRESAQGFAIDEYVIGDAWWTEGFTWDGPPAADLSITADMLDCMFIDATPDVFVLDHRRIVGSHQVRCLIGIYATHSDALAVANRLVKQQGFCSFPQGFSTYGLGVNAVHWNNGFSLDEYRHQRMFSLTLSSIGP